MGQKMTDRYENIRKALEMRPTPGPWFHGAANGAHMYCVYDKRCWTDEDGARHGETPNMIVHVSPDDGKYANAAYIAACDPDTIRELLAERDALAAVRAERTDAHGWLFCNPDTGIEWLDQHPIESGEVPDAENIRPASAEEVVTLLREAWNDLAAEHAAREKAEAQLAEARKALANLCDWIEHEVGAELPFDARRALEGGENG